MNNLQQLGYTKPCYNFIYPSLRGLNPQFHCGYYSQKQMWQYVDLLFKMLQSQHPNPVNSLPARRMPSKTQASSKALQSAPKTNKGSLIDIELNTDAFKSAISELSYSIETLNSELNAQKNLVKELVKSPYEKLSKMNYRAAIPMNPSAKDYLNGYCTQIEQIMTELSAKLSKSTFPTLREDLDDLLLTKDTLSTHHHRLNSLESQILQAVTQQEWRLSTLELSESVDSKLQKCTEQVYEETSQVRGYADEKVGEIQQRVAESEVKTVCKIRDCEVLLKQRVSEGYLDNMLRARDDRLNKVIERTSDRNILRMDTMYKELTAKDDSLDKQQSEDRKKTLERERLFAYKSDYDASHKHIQHLEKKINEFHSEYDDQLTDFKKSILEFNKRVTEVAKTLANIVKENEDLSNAAQMASAAQDLLNSCSIKLATTDKEMQKMHKIIETKIGNDDFYKTISKKMDRSEIMNMIGSEEEKERIKECVKKETSHLDKTIRDMERYWDQKLVKMRQDLNVHQLMKRLNEKVSVTQANTMHDENSMRIEECEDTLHNLGQDMQYIANSFGSIRKYVVDIKKIHSDCTKSASCLSCGNDQNKTNLKKQNNIKGLSSQKFPGILKKGRPHLEDRSMVEYDVGIKVFSGKFRPKSAHKFRTKNQIKSNLKFSRANKLAKDKNLESYSPSRVYDINTDNENSFLQVNKSINSLRETQDVNDNSVYTTQVNELNTKY
ncbi:unnamed protein product [Moneuplotes crassus]|uniref:Uncharacterized protein n=1 Tax=Euplotes crassus TaxID=5936 RepID=A0AAD1Y7Y8_EUPCR|nr:unnamed protein product [Moneuplotes crassus]